MATNTTTGGSTPPDPSNLRSPLTDAFAQADDTAAERVQQLQWVYQARASQLSRTAADLKAQPGADDAEVKRAEAALSSARAVSSHLARVHQRITTPVPDVPADGWALHGHVFNAEGKPAPGFTVFLVDAAQIHQQAYGFAYTDDAGYFLLKYEGGSAASRERSTTAQQTRASQLFVQVADLKARPVYLSKTAFQPAGGTATYQDIILREGNKPLGEPPPQARKAAAPKGKPKT